MAAEKRRYAGPRLRDFGPIRVSARRRMLKP
jgi:hypothetical protein